MLRDLWHRLNGWPEDRRKKPAQRFPAKTYFLDGPLRDETRAIPPCLFYALPALQFVGGAPGGYCWTEIRYVWDTLYLNAEVAYMRLDRPQITS